MRAQYIAQQLGNCRKEGRGWRCRCPLHGGTSLNLADSSSGKLLVTCWHGCDAVSVLHELRRLGLLENEAPLLSEKTFKWMERRERERRAQEEIERKAKQSLALAIWKETQPIEGTPAERYLRARYINIQPPKSLRYHPGLEHGPTGLVLPCVVAAVQGVDRHICGIHRTFLKSDGSGKATVLAPKMSLGPISGGAVRMDFARDNTWLLVGEGIESTLSAMQISRLPGWAALSTSGMKALKLPPTVTMVMIAADRDQNRAGEIAANAAHERWTSEGRRVRIVFPPALLNDFNDVLRFDLAGGVQDVA
jgi:hypothetical protein